jgi:hypothetical protein
MLRARFGERMYIVQFQDGREPDRILAENALSPPGAPRQSSPLRSLGAAFAG